MENTNDMLMFSIDSCGFTTDMLTQLEEKLMQTLSSNGSVQVLVCMSVQYSRGLPPSGQCWYTRRSRNIELY